MASPSPQRRSVPSSASRSSIDADVAPEDGDCPTNSEADEGGLVREIMTRRRHRRRADRRRDQHRRRRRHDRDRTPATRTDGEAPTRGGTDRKRRASSAGALHRRSKMTALQNAGDLAGADLVRRLSLAPARSTPINTAGAATRHDRRERRQRSRMTARSTPPARFTTNLDACLTAAGGRPTAWAANATARAGLAPTSRTPRTRGRSRRVRTAKRTRQARCGHTCGDRAPRCRRRPLRAPNRRLSLRMAASRSLLRHRTPYAAGRDTIDLAARGHARRDTLAAPT